MTTRTTDAETLVEKVRERYAGLATTAGHCCGSGVNTADTVREIGYAPESLEALESSAGLSLGCGAPINHLGLEPGETVLDLGSGGGLDAFLAARQVGPTGRVIGVDMTPEMLARARAAAAQGGFDQVEFRQGRLEELPVDDATVDAVTSNCVINLVPDKGAVFREVARVLKPGGRLVVSDIVLAAPLPEALADDLYAYVGCVSGAELREDYFALLAAAGLGELEVLSEVDFLEVLTAAAPAEVERVLGSVGVSPEEVRGRVRSITFRAVRTG